MTFILNIETCVLVIFYSNDPQWVTETIISAGICFLYETGSLFTITAIAIWWSSVQFLIVEVQTHGISTILIFPTRNLHPCFLLFMVAGNQPTVTRVLGWFQKQLAVALVTSRLLQLPAVDAHLSANLINSKETVKSAAHAGDGDHSPFQSKSCRF